MVRCLALLELSSGQIFNVNTKQVVVLKRVHEILINQSPSRDNPCNLTVIHGRSCFLKPLALRQTNLLADRHLLSVILHEHLQIAIELRSLETSHGHISENSGSFSFLEIDKMCVLVDLVKVHFVKVSHAGEHNAVAELADIVEVLLEDWRIDLFRRRVGLEFGESWEYALD